MAFKEAITYLLATGMTIKSFISDRHASIAKWMREECGKRCTELGKPVINHFLIYGTLAKVSNLDSKQCKHHLIIYCI